MADEEQEFEIVDKRKVKLDSEGNVVAEPDKPTEAASETEEPAQEEFAGYPPVDVYGLLKSFMGLLGAHAWRWLGLIKSPATGNLEQDLIQAKIAIDAISSMADQLEGHTSADEQREIEAMLSDLRMNFVQQSAGMRQPPSA